ncbi:MAG: HEAT repeat domain-containing protein, partial [Proteobacteria bacterium]|nr:HEAT repeat domain-containing protein [Pseudomonadota bacterium]
RALGRHPSQADLPALLTGLQDPSPEVRHEALEGTEVLHESSLEPVLHQMVQQDDNASVRAAAAEALADLRGVLGRPIPALWHFVEVYDHLSVDPLGGCTLLRRVELRIDSAAEPVVDIHILMPPTFSDTHQVQDDKGTDLPFREVWTRGVREVRIDVAPIDEGETLSLELTAQSKRPLFSAPQGHQVVYGPGPLHAPADRVEVILTGPTDKTLGGEVWTSVHPDKAHGLTFRAPLLSGVTPAAPRPRPPSRAHDLGVAAGVCFAVLMALAWQVRRLRRRGGEYADHTILAWVLLAGALLLLTPIFLEDNLGYYSMARAAVLDGTLDRYNGLQLFNQNLTYAPDTRAAQDPQLAAFFRMPAVAFAHLLNTTLSLFGQGDAPTGMSFPYRFVVGVWDFFAMLLGCLATLSLVRRRISRDLALPAVLAVVWGTNLLIFTYAWTGGSFQPSFFLFAVFLNAWDRSRDNRTWLTWLIGGVAIGLLGWTRSLNWLFFLVPFLDWAWWAAARPLSKLAGHVRNGFTFVFGVALGFAPQLCLVRLLDDRWWVDVYGVGRSRFLGFSDQIWDLLWVWDTPDSYDYTGIVLGMPVFVLAVVGLVPLWRRDMRLGASAVTTLACMLMVIGSYEGASGLFEFATPYFAPASPLLCLGMASLLVAVREHLGRWGLLGVGALMVLGICRNLWCTVHQLADELIGDWARDMGDLEIIHTMLFPVRKLDHNVLAYSTEFGCLFRETAGAILAGSMADLFAALAWSSLLILPIVLAPKLLPGGLALWRRVPSHRRLIGLACLVLLPLSWALSLGATTNLDRNYRYKKRTSREREIKPYRLVKGERFSWSFKMDSPIQQTSIITYLSDGIAIPKGTPVATVRVESGGWHVDKKLLAGIHTADFAVDRPEASGIRQHESPTEAAAYSWRVQDDSDRLYTAHAYLTKFKLPSGWNGKMEVTALLDEGQLHIVRLDVVEQPLQHSGMRWLADRW